MIFTEIKDCKEGSKILYSCRFWYYKNGIKKSKYKSGFTKKKEAEKWGIDTKRMLEGLSAGAADITVKCFLERWIKIKEGKLSPTTLSGYKVNINHINNYMGEVDLLKVKLIDVQEMLDELTRSGLKNKTVKYVYRTLHAALEYAIKTETIIKNPCKGAEIKEDESKFEASIYTSEDLKSLIIALKDQRHHLYPLVLLASMRGLRRGECLGLRWSDIDFEREAAHVRNNYVMVGGKGYHRKVKTKESERLVNMDGFVAAELKSHKENSKKNSIPTYVCETKGELPDPTHISRQLNLFQKANNLPICRFHDLRHTFAVLQLEHGTDLDTLKRLLGHSKVGITSDTYLHRNINLVKKASMVMDNIILVDFEEKEKMSQ